MMRCLLFAASVAAVAGFASVPQDDAPTFNRVASFYVCTQLDPMTSQPSRAVRGRTTQLQALQA